MSIDITNLERDLANAQTAGEPENWSISVPKADLRALLHVYKMFSHEVDVPTVAAALRARADASKVGHVAT